MNCYSRVVVKAERDETEEGDVEVGENDENDDGLQHDNTTTTTPLEHCQ